MSGDLESEVKIVRGRPMAKMVLNSGHVIYYHEGCIRAVHCPDRISNAPDTLEWVRQSAEYKDPTRFSRDEVVEKVRRLLVEGLGLSASDLYLDTEPVFTRNPNPEAKEGVRRYSFSWRRPESQEERKEREAKRIIPPTSIAVEIDGVSGDIKSISFFDRSFQRPDPELGMPVTTNAPPSALPIPTDGDR